MLLTEKIKEELRDLQHNNKTPSNSNNHVGVEIEFYCNTTREILAIEFYKEGLKDKIMVGTDNSVKNYPMGFFGHEVKVLDDEDNIFKTLQHVCSILMRFDARVNITCGLHVHLDMRNRDKNVVFHNLVKSQKILYKMNPKRRLVGEFSKLLDVNTLDKAMEKYPEAGGRQDRYFGVNHHSLKRHNTLEVRIHAGMIDKDKIINWVKLLTHIANIKEISPEYKTTSGFFKKFTIPIGLQVYVTQRLELFKEGEDDLEESA